MKGAGVAHSLSQHLMDIKQGTGVTVLYAVYMREATLTDQRKIIEQCFESWELPFISVATLLHDISHNL